MDQRDRESTPDIGSIDLGNQMVEQFGRPKGFDDLGGRDDLEDDEHQRVREVVKRYTKRVGAQRFGHKVMNDGREGDADVKYGEGRADVICSFRYMPNEDEKESWQGLVR
ncbi:hypothetical protein Scep_014919 [Stephania cephalantha]|uniref:Uncharacterized protein n=1 Tax=Stephania cephalantha TaxID=152367 RepID=A0AAP0J288_9MAGN